MPQRSSERSIVFLIGAVQFINILDFMMVMPLGPDFARALAIDGSHLGLIGGSYAAAAAISGLLGSLFLDRFDRRKVLALAMLGLVLGTAAGGLATGLYSLMAARVLAGFFGGPATSVALAIVADLVPRERLGKAMGAVMGAFSIASVVGVPIGLKLSLLFGWQAPFFSVGGLGLLITALVIFLLPPMTMHLEGRRAAPKPPPAGELFRRPLVLLSYGLTAMNMIAAFILIPSISTYVQENLQYPRADMDLLYLGGGVVSYLAMRVVGHLVDRYGSFRVGSAGAAMLTFVLYFGFVSYLPGMPVIFLYVGFMAAMAFRNVSTSTLSSKVPGPAERASYMSIQSAVQHLASALGAMLSTQLLRELPNKRLEGIPRVAGVSIALTLLAPLVLLMVERRVSRPEAKAPPIEQPQRIAH
jgi:predicted MFS family arabinose efflux permease